MRVRQFAAAALASVAVISAALGAARADDDEPRAQASVVAPTAPTPDASGAAAAPPSAASASAAATSTSPATATTKPSSSASPSPTSTAVTVPENGTGRMSAVLVPGADTRGSGRVVRYALEIEGGLGVDHDQVAKIVGETLRDRRGWQKVDDVRFVQVTPTQRKNGTVPDVTISLVSPGLTDTMCAPLSTEGELSCANKEHAVLNYRRWATGVAGFTGKDGLRTYRQYLVNHEVGHELGHSHATCSGKRRTAPLMMQQTKGLNGCKPNAWPSVA